MYPQLTRPLPLADLRRSAGSGVQRVQNVTDESADLYIYEEIGFWGVTASDVARDLAAIGNKPINLRVNSPGGDVFDGLAIYTMLREHSAPVTSYVDGLAASAASTIALAGERVVMARPAYMMIHNAMGFAWGYASEMRRQADLLDKISGTIAEIYQERAGGSLQQWLDAMDAETWYTAAEAVAAGLAHEVSGGGEASPDATDTDDPRAAYRRSIAAQLADAMRARAGAPGTTTHTNRLPASPVDALDIEFERDRLAVASAELWRP